MPSRASVSLIDSNTFSPGWPGGGNLGFAVDAWTTIKLAPTAGEVSADEVSGDYESKLLTHSTLLGWREFSKVARRYKVIIETYPPRHIGLASSSALQAALLIALNHFDEVFSDEKEMLAHHSRNYTEVTGSGIEKGFTTGLGAFIALNGGFAMIDTDLEPIFSMVLPEWPVYVAVPRARYDTTWSSEKHVLLGRARQLDRRDAFYKRQIISSQLLPALRLANLQKIGEAIFELQLLGSKLAEIESRPEDLMSKISMLRNCGIECVFMSSLGPAVVIITQQENDTVFEILRSAEFEVLHQGKIVSRTALVEL